MATRTGLSVGQAEAIVDAMAELGVEAEVYEDYSGRGMYGDTVTAITSDDPRAQMALAYVASDVEVDWDDLPTRTDSMGLGVVIY